jgi:hypothetical protein
MPAIDAIIQYGETMENSSLVEEPALLVQSLKITPSREKQTWKRATHLAIGMIRYTNPMITFAFNAIVGTVTGFANQHPGTLVTELANFAAHTYEFDPDEGIMVFEDPSRDQSLENPMETDFTVVQYPFIDSDATSWTPSNA